jgi:hypothetical protein
METIVENINSKRTIRLNLNRKEFIKLFHLMDEKDKVSIYKELKKDLFLNRFENLLKSLKTDKLSLEDITKEVEIVRQERYETGKQVI